MRRVGFVAAIYEFFSNVTDGLQSVLEPFALFFLRLAVAVPFLKAGLTKWSYVRNNDLDTLYFLFEDYNVPYLSVKAAAWAGMLGELILPVLLLAGFFTRIGAAGLLVMTAVIYITDQNQHAPYWAAICLFLALRGPGGLSLDGPIRAFFKFKYA